MQNSPISPPNPTIPPDDPLLNEDSLRELYIRAGFPEHLWLNVQFLPMLLRSATPEKLPPRVNLDLPMNPEELPPQVLSKVPEEIRKRFLAQFPHMERQFYFFTECDLWWNGDPSFLVEDATTYLQFVTYDLQKRNPELRPKVEEVKVPRPRGRPRIHERKPSDAGVRYQQWLDDCARYRSELDALWAEYVVAREQAQKARDKWSELKAQGAPKWSK